MIPWLQRLWRCAIREPGPAAARAGRLGEQLAEEFLRGRAGYEIVARNWRSPHDQRAELDLVCRDGEVLVFVEVKTRAENALVPGYYAVDARKKQALRRAIHAYLAALRHKPRTFRFDVAEVVTRSAAPPQVRHFQNIPLFPKGYHVTP